MKAIDPSQDENVYAPPRAQLAQKSEDPRHWVIEPLCSAGRAVLDYVILVCGLWLLVVLLEPFTVGEFSPLLGLGCGGMLVGAVLLRDLLLAPSQRVFTRKKAVATPMEQRP